MIVLFFCSFYFTFSKLQPINYLINVANDESVNNEKNNMREIAIFKNGVTL